MNLMSACKYNKYLFMIIVHVSTINYIYHILSYISDTLKLGISDTKMDFDWLLIILQFYCLNRWVIILRTSLN